MEVLGPAASTETNWETAVGRGDVFKLGLGKLEQKLYTVPIVKARKWFWKFLLGK